MNTTVDLTRFIRDVPDFPKPGIIFKDITPLLGAPEALQHTIARLAEPYADAAIEAVVAIESRGFIFGGALACQLGCGFVPVRKPGKLPWKRHRHEYELEYGTDAIEMHTDALRSGTRTLIVDDVLATGGTAAAAANLVRLCDADIAGFAFLIELGFLGGRAKLGTPPVHSLLRYD